jgi:hypothetical protein
MVIYMGYGYDVEYANPIIRWIRARQKWIRETGDIFAWKVETLNRCGVS